MERNYKMYKFIKKFNRYLNIFFFIYKQIFINLIFCIVIFIPYFAEGREISSQVILLVHGISINPNEPNKVWEGDLSKNNTKKRSFNKGMIGFLKAKGYNFGGIIRSKNGTINLPECLYTNGITCDPKQAQLFSLEFSKSAAHDGLAYKCLELKNCINELTKYKKVKKVEIIAHSAGGLVARAYLQSALPTIKYMNDISKLITIGTPHFGSSLANKFGAFLGIHVSSLKPTAGLLQDINNNLKLPEDVLYASIIIRGFAADVRGDGKKYDPYINQEIISRLPIDFRQGGDQVVHVKSQNLSLAKCAMEYEKKTKKPILYFIVRVSDPSPEDIYFGEEKVHCVAPSDLKTQNMIYYLLNKDYPWIELERNVLNQIIKSRSRLFAISVIENEVLKKHKLSEVNKVSLNHFEQLQYQNNSQPNIFSFSGDANSKGKIVRIFSRKTSIKGKIKSKFDKYGRVVYFTSSTY